ncbi:helix-turn-helix domain-containing protein [Fredinandcohnia humi]
MKKYDQFRLYAAEMKMKEPLAIFKRLEESDGKEDENDLNQISKMIDESNMPDAMRKVLRSKHRVLTKRLKCGVPSYFPERVKMYRDSLRLTMNEAARKTNGMVSVAYWSRIEKGQRKQLSTSTIKAIADVLEVPMTELLGLSVEKEMEKKQIPLNQMILENNWTINETEVSMEQKKGILNLLETIHNTSWSHESKHIETLSIFKAINDYKTQF